MSQQFLDLEQCMNVDKRRATEQALAEIIESQNGRIRNEVAPRLRTSERISRFFSLLRFKILLANARRQDKKAEASSALQKLFHFLDLVSQILPSKTRIQTFEPAYFDEKADYLRARQRFTGRVARKWLVLCFCFRYVVLITQSFGAMCSEKIKNAFWAALGGAIVWLRR